MAGEKTTNVTAQLDAENLNRASGGQELFDGSYDDYNVGDTITMSCPRCGDNATFYCAEKKYEYFYWVCRGCEKPYWVFDADCLEWGPMNGYSAY